MKRKYSLVLLLLALVGGTAFAVRLLATDLNSFQTTEYGTIRWAGRENTCFIRPNGKVESLGPLLTKAPRPERVDERTYYMSLAINAVAKQGFEVTAFSVDEVLMKRAAMR